MTDTHAIRQAGIATDSAREFLTISDVAALFGRTPRTIRNWIHRGDLKPIRIGRSLFIKQSDIDALLGGEEADNSNSYEEFGNTSPK